jgi:hypothetical protein
MLHGGWRGGVHGSAKTEMGRCGSTLLTIKGACGLYYRMVEQEVMHEAERGTTSSEEVTMELVSTKPYLHVNTITYVRGGRLHLSVQENGAADIGGKVCVVRHD